MSRTFSRRRFLATSAMALAAAQLRAQQQSSQPSSQPPAPRVRAALQVPAEANGPEMPADFIGLSYEVQQLTDPHFFSARNTGLIRAFKEVSPHGVLRLGGNTSEFAWWKATPETPEPQHPRTREVVGEPRASYYAVTPEAVRNLLSFLKETGWTCIYGIGMGTNTPDRAATEAVYVAQTLGDRLQYFQIGNEADLFSSHLRDPKTWSAKTYLDEWLVLARAISARVPDAKFGMPDVASRIDWLTDIAAAWPTVPNPPHVTTLTHHYYFGGPATNPAVNIPNLMAPATMAKVQKTCDIANAAAQKMNARVRMTEGNTCYRGGKPGVSDVFASALWSADYSLLLASNNYSGVNLHGGTGKSVANSVGGSLPGDALLKQQGATPSEIESHPHPFYTPIATFGSEYVLEPVAHGLQFAGAFSGGKLFKIDFNSTLQAAGIDATAYAAELPGGKRSIIILNKDLEKDLELTLDFGPDKDAMIEKQKLEATSIDSREAKFTEPFKSNLAESGRYQLLVPHASGVRITHSRS
jgi:hypothetical protein